MLGQAWQLPFDVFFCLSWVGKERAAAARDLPVALSHFVSIRPRGSATAPALTSRNDPEVWEPPRGTGAPAKSSPAVGVTWKLPRRQNPNGHPFPAPSFGGVPVSKTIHLTIFSPVQPAAACERLAGAFSCLFGHGNGDNDGHNRG